MVTKTKSSIRNYRCRYVQGGDTIVNKKKQGWWEQDIDIPRNDITDIQVYITPKLAGRPDLIAQQEYGNAKLAWLVLQYNSIVDTVEELAVGKTIIIPSKNRALFSILTKS